MQPLICIQRGLDSVRLEVSPGDLQPPWSVPGPRLFFIYLQLFLDPVVRFCFVFVLFRSWKQLVFGIPRFVKFTNLQRVSLS